MADRLLQRAGSSWQALLRHLLLTAGTLALLVASAAALSAFAPSINEALVPAGAGAFAVFPAVMAAIRRWRCGKR